ncbi:MAG: protein kinase [Myxococcales bacterium]|nr:protein kinase [Myxococcales bacterium]
MDPNYPGGPPPPDPIIGLTIGNYQVRQKLGEGGMGSVYLAEHPHIGKKVALKVLHAEFASNTDVVTRFFNEAKAVNDIGHPNIVDVIDYGVLQTGPTGEGLVYFIMEFLPGLTLGQLLQREAPLAPERALGIALQVSDALAASHKNNIVHRDLKPDNIILIQRGREHDFVKLLDFGIAKLTGDQPGSRRTRTGLVMGTPAYMSPEQCEGRGNVDHRSDIYALGVVLYEMITGRVPFFGEGYGEVLVQHLTAAPPPPSTIRGIIPPHVEQVILKALEKRPEMRFPTMDEMSKAMADPVGYVEAHGGIGQFLATPLVPTNDPIPMVSRLTPSPLISPLTPVPGQMTTPTTLGGAAGTAITERRKKPLGLFIGIGVALAAAAVAVVVVTSGGGSGSGSTDPGTGTSAGLQPGTGTAVEPGTGTADPGTGTAGTDPGPGTAGTGTADPGTGTADPGTGTADPGTGTADPGAGSGTAGAGTGTADPAGGSQVAAKISITVASSPSGAWVTFGDETDPRGKTPITFTVDKADADAIIEIDLRGYKVEERKVRLSGQVDLEVALSKARGSRPSGSNSGSGSGSSAGSSAGSGSSTGPVGDDMMDPFAKKKTK